MTQQLTITRPDDWHLHFRDGNALQRTVPDSAAVFGRVLCMPNLTPPVTTVAEAEAYRNRILAAATNASPSFNNPSFDPVMALYLTEATDPREIATLAASSHVRAVKLYPAGATTNSHAGVRSLDAVFPVIEAMEEHGVRFLLHGEVTDQHVDIFDREKRFLDTVLEPLLKRFPTLKVVLEHITTADAAEFVLSQSDRVAATITPQHLMFNRNDMLVGGIRPHLFCLPILKRQTHQQRLLEVATSGNPKFFLGTDSAPHAQDKKETACGCAGCYSAPYAMGLYAEVFEEAGKLDRLEAFASHYGADFYGLPRNRDTITLIRQPQIIASSLPYLDEQALIPLRAGETLAWSVA